MMNKLLKYEWHCLLRQKSLYICLGVSAFMQILTMLLATLPLFGGSMAYWENQFLQTLPDSINIFIIPIVAALNASRDFQNGSLRLIIGRGYTAAQVGAAKYLIFSLINVIFSLKAWCVSLIGNSISDAPMPEISGRILLLLLIQMFLIMGISSIAYFLVMITHRSAGGITTCVLLPIFGGLPISLVQMLLDHFNVQLTLSHYWPWDCLSELCDTAVSNNALLRITILAAVYCAACFIGGIQIFQKQDV